MSARSRVLPIWLAVMATALSPSATADPNEISAPRFVPVEVYLESPEPVAAWQFELADRAGAMQVVGIERGGHDAFPRAPYYDRDALTGDTAPRIVVADYSLVLESALPRGRFRVATLHVMLDGEPDFALRLVTATTAGGVPIDAAIALGDSPADPEETEP